MNSRDLEKYSSAFTLSDMEIFIFPELLYSLVLANIISPEIWKWREDKWFQKIESTPPMKRIQRVKQYIMDHYDFNLDLETWGLTDKESEISRFREFIDPEILKRSNALFGYEGDRYYFDIDIRKHFGLDKFDTEIIPYWKTETVEAMNAFRFKPDHPVGAGECVSLATLYAAALFIVARIPLEQIFLMGTPLHSQNFVMVDDGVLTNNRRIVTKAMWYNGSELSALARRALEHEQVAIVAHQTGYIHTIFPEATINREEYHRFKEALTAFLNIRIDYEIFLNFLRSFSRYQKRFQLMVPCRGTVKYLVLEKAFGYEHGSKNRLGDKTAKRLLCEIGEEEFSPSPYDNRAIISSKDELFGIGDYHDFIDSLTRSFPGLDPDGNFSHDLKRFVHTVPRLPVGKRTSGQVDQRTSGPADERTSGPADQRTRGGISVGMSREEILETVLRCVIHNPRSDSPASGIRYPASDIGLALYTGRYMDYCDWKPFLKAVMERNPVSVVFFREMSVPEIIATLNEWPEASIYDGNRLALPDEVVNFCRGDGIEKALTLANVIRARDKGARIALSIKNQEVMLKVGSEKYLFASSKSFVRSLEI